MAFLWVVITLLLNEVTTYKCHIPTPDAVSLYMWRYTISGSFDLTLSCHIYN